MTTFIKTVETAKHKISFFYILLCAVNCTIINIRNTKPYTAQPYSLYNISTQSYLRILEFASNKYKLIHR